MLDNNQLLIDRSFTKAVHFHALLRTRILLLKLLHEFIFALSVGSRARSLSEHVVVCISSVVDLGVASFALGQNQRRLLRNRLEAGLGRCLETFVGFGTYTLGLVGRVVDHVAANMS